MHRSTLSPRSHLTLAALAAALAWPALASADGSRGNRSGALGSVTSGVAAQTGSSGGSSASTGSSSSGSSSSSSSHDDSDGYYATYPSHCVGCERTYGSATLGPQGPRGPVISGASLALGVAAVRNSDAAARAAARLMSGRMGLGVEGTHYVERDRGGSGEWIRMNLWSVTGIGRLYATPSTSLALTGGLAGTSATAFEQIMGPTVGVELEHRFALAGGTEVSPRASARVMAFERDVTAYEGVIGVQISRFSIGYRYLAFVDVEPALHGPELGVVLAF